MAFAIHDRGHRARLESRAKPYFVRLTDDLHLGYRKGKMISRWVVRTRKEGRYRTSTVRSVQPDDFFTADGHQVLSFQQMVERVMTEPKSKVCCSFCGNGHRQVSKLIAGPGVFICDACVAMCQLYIDYPAENAKLRIEEGKPVMKKGKPVFVPLSDEELKRRDELLEADA